MFLETSIRELTLDVGFFNHYLTGDVDNNGKQTTPWWEETELRTFTFVDGDENAAIKETEESLTARGASE